jgi:hypothetical protein
MIMSNEEGTTSEFKKSDKAIKKRMPGIVTK